MFPMSAYQLAIRELVVDIFGTFDVPFIMFLLALIYRNDFMSAADQLIIFVLFCLVSFYLTSMFSVVIVG